MRFNALENFFGKKPENQLPREIFRDDKAFREFFLKYVGRPGWAEKQAQFAKKQIQHTDPYVNANNYHRLVGTEWIDLLNPSNLDAFNEDAQFESFEHMPATWALHFLQLPEDKIPDSPGYFTVRNEEDLRLPAGEITDQITQLEIRLTSDPEWAQKISRPTEDDLYEWSPKVLSFIKQLGLLPLYADHSSKEFIPHWKYALEQIVIFLEKQEKFLYASFVVDTAIEQIVQIIPEWKLLSQTMRDNLIVHISSESKGDNTYCTGEFHHVVLEQSDKHNAHTFTDNFLVAVHELIHAMVKEYLFGRKIIKSKDSNTPQFMSVIQEGAAITAEQAVIQLYDLKNRAEQLPEWATTRMLKTVAVLQERHAHDLSQVGKIAHYTEGVRLARRFAKMGWRVENLPAILEHIHDTALDIRGTNDASEFYLIKVTYEKNSEYQRIFSAIFENVMKK